MLDLEQMRARAATLDDAAPTTVSGRWLRQVIAELSAARTALCTPLDLAPTEAAVMSMDLAGASGSFTALIATPRERRQRHDH